jgi:hypothetical protein
LRPTLRTLLAGTLLALRTLLAGTLLPLRPLLARTLLAGTLLLRTLLAGTALTAALALALARSGTARTLRPLSLAQGLLLGLIATRWTARTKPLRTLLTGTLLTLHTLLARTLLGPWPPLLGALLALTPGLVVHESSCQRRSW